MVSVASFADACRTLVGLPLSRAHRGHGSALLLEFGKLDEEFGQGRARPAHSGMFGIMIEWSWRIEQGDVIVCGSFSDEALWAPAFADLMGRCVTSLSTFGRLPEIMLELEGDSRVISFMTAEDDPTWVLFDRRAPTPQSYFSQRGNIVSETYGIPAEPLRSMSEC